MSLVIITVEREKRTHTIHSDGIEVRNDYMDIASQSCNKIRKLEYKGHSILVGTCGHCTIGRYIRNHITEYLEEFRVFEKMHEHIDDVEEFFIRMFRKMYDAYKEDMHTEHYVEFTCALSIDGHLFSVQNYDDGEVDCRVLTDSDILCIGLGGDIATALIENDVPIKKVFATVHRHKTCVGENMYTLSANF